ncbi:hypothetical protein I5M27_08425 [Adhaeribacter sp. BT258]|uniref:Uncharacterized protein n=1 Tax=Adhaeribacter terrigena TaxID=2793070 RepID=A0ABS1C375_9BACT|nr:hypothetical protein [Adhaeribacter terrigena]MBK0403010.1 hypothetical protein [Adhaeribacter terrigena]
MSWLSKVFTPKRDDTKNTPSEMKGEQMETDSDGSNNIPIDHNNTTKRIAYVLLFAFIISVALLFYINYDAFQYGAKKPDPSLVDIEMRKGWFDLLKNALVLLGTALTTVIGYYFGQRAGALKAEEAEKKEKDAVDKIEIINQKAEDVVKNQQKQVDQVLKEFVKPENENPFSNQSPSQETDDGIVIPPQ